MKQNSDAFQFSLGCVDMDFIKQILRRECGRQNPLVLRRHSGSLSLRTRPVQRPSKKVEITSLTVTGALLQGTSILCLHCSYVSSPLRYYDTWGNALNFLVKQNKYLDSPIINHWVGTLTYSHKMSSMMSCCTESTS